MITNFGIFRQMNRLPSFPTIIDYKRISKSLTFKQMENFSNHFLATNEKILDSYSRRWVKDPFHQWSRQYEYPFVYNHIVDYLKNSSSSKIILDAGSGATFFPYFVASKIPRSKIICIDSDAYLNPIFKKLNEKPNLPIKFLNADLKSLPLTLNSLDIIYCISVIEHAHNRQKIFKEFKRILKKGGLLVITFDINLKLLRAIPPCSYSSIIDDLIKNFRPLGNYDPIVLEKRLNSPLILTTDYIRKTNPQLLPWKNFSRIKSFLKNLTVFCGSFSA